MMRMALSQRERSIVGSLIPQTLHRTLGWTPSAVEDGGPWRYNRRNKLRARLVLVDEASMADTELIAALLEALPNEAALILLGDRDQLDSVEAGGVLAELVARGSQGQASDARRAQLQRRCPAQSGDHTPQAPSNDAQQHDASAHRPLPGLTHSLVWSYRAKNAPWVLGS